MANIEHNSISLTSRLKNRDAARKIKHGSPKLQEVLRQRCRQRMREKRDKLFDKRRQGLMNTDEEVQETLTEIVREELSQLATLDKNQQNILLGGELSEPMTHEEAFIFKHELLAEEEQWIFEEYERLQKDEAETLAHFAEESLKDDTICPLCEKGIIMEVLDFLACPACNLRLPLKASAKDFGRMIQNNLAMHSSSCSGQPSFMLLPENNTVSLYLTCETCSVFFVII